jgi:hypothetical protein
MPFASVAPHFMVREIEGSLMIELDPYFFYWVARDAHVLLRGINTQQPPNFIVLSYARDALQKFVSSGKEDFLPKSRARASAIVNFLDPIINVLRQGGQVVFTVEDYAHYHAFLTEFEEQFQEESKHLYALCVEDQRLLSAYVLVEHIEKAVAPKTWKFMSKLARREIEESGKCLALERYTASGFHILRCIESIVKEYILACGVTLSPADRNWGRYSEILGKNGAASEVTSILDNLRRDDRNTLMHPEKFLAMDEAIGLFYLCQTALDRLINDMEKRGFAKEFVP